MREGVEEEMSPMWPPTSYGAECEAGDAGVKSHTRSHRGMKERRRSDCARTLQSLLQHPYRPGCREQGLRVLALALQAPGPHTGPRPRGAVQGPEESSRLDAADRRGSV